MNTKLKRVLTAVVAASMVFSLTALGVTAASSADSAAFISEVSQDEYALFVDGGELQLYRNGQLVRADEMRTNKVVLFESEDGGIAVQFVNLDGERIKITLGDQLHLAIGGKVDSLTISSDVPSSAVIDIAPGARIRSMRVESRSDVNIKDDAKVTTLYVTNRRANVYVENDAIVNKVYTVSRNAVSGVSSRDVYVTRDSRWDDDDDDDDDRRDKNRDKDKDKGNDSSSSSESSSNSDPYTVSTPQQLKDAIARGKTNIVLAAGVFDLDDIAKSNVRITVSNGATLNLDKATASGVRINVQSGGKMSGYQHIGNGNTVTAAKGAELFWTDNSGSTSTLVGNGGFINPSSGSVTIRGQQRDKKYDITINGDATIQQSTADGQQDVPLVIDDGVNLIINGEVTVADGTGNTTLAVVPRDGVVSYVLVNGKLIVENADKVQGGVNVIGDPSKITAPNGNPIQLTRAQLAMLRAGMSLEEVLAATAPENESSSGPEQSSEPETTVPEESKQLETESSSEDPVASSSSEPEIPSKDPVTSEPEISSNPEISSQNPVTSEPSDTKKPNQKDPDLLLPLLLPEEEKSVSEDEVEVPESEESSSSSEPEAPNVVE